MLGDGYENDEFDLDIKSADCFEALLPEAIIPGLSIVESDSILTAAVNAISNFTKGGDAIEAHFSDIADALAFALASANGGAILRSKEAIHQPIQAAAAIFAGLRCQSELPSLKASIMARLALIRAFNRRTRHALPWLPIRPCQEGSAILGGMCGHGASADKAARSRVSDGNSGSLGPSSLDRYSHSIFARPILLERQTKLDTEHYASHDDSNATQSR